MCGPEASLLAGDALVPQGFFPIEQVLLQVVGEPRREIFALRIGDLAAFENRDDLALVDAIAKPLSQLRDHRR